MSDESGFGRRSFLRAGALAAFAVSGAGALSSCATGGGGDTGGASSSSSGGGAPASDDNPFGMAEGGTVDIVIFKGGYGDQYAQDAGKVMEQLHSGTTVKVSPSTEIAKELQPRFVGGNPPDCFDNSGAGSIGIGSIVGQLETLDQLLEAKNTDGVPIKDTLYDGVQAPGTFGGKFVALNYVMTVYALWYSQSTFDDMGLEVPKTWDDMMKIGDAAKKKDKYLFTWGREAATYYQELMISAAIKDGGDEVRLALENLQPNCFSNASVQKSIKALEDIVKAGYVQPGGAGTQFTAAQAQWTKGDSLMYPSGSWIENEMKDQTPSDFKMTGCPVPLLAEGGAMPLTALHSAAGEPFLVPSQAKNKAGGLEYLRVMLSKESATNFAKLLKSPTIVKDTVPEDGFGSTALQAQSKMLKDAGTDVYTWNFIDYYGTNKDMLGPWNSFMGGRLDAAGLTKALQDIVDKVREDDSIEKVEVK